MNHLTANPDWEGIVTKGNASWRLLATAGAKTVYFASSGTTPNNDIYGTRNVNDGNWHYVAAVYDGTNLSLYVDGTLDVSKAASGSIWRNSDPVCIGYIANTGLPGNYHFDGLIDEVSIYSRALSSNEIAAIYSAGSAGKCFTATPPVIITQPTNQMASVGGTATFRVSATGTQPLFYQWRFNGTNILGATNALLTLSNVQPVQAGIYVVQVANGGGSTNSANAVLTVITPPSSVPVITGFSPASGMTGISVRISGTNFSPVAASNTVYFGAVKAVVSAASATNLVVSVPAGATYAPITVTVKGLTAYANAPFLPTFASSGMLSSSSLGPQMILPAGRGPGQVVITDFDGDGKPDLAGNSGLDHTICIYRNISTNGFLATNSFAPPVVLQLGTGSEWGMVAADVDGDGKPDLVFLDYNSNVVSVLQNLCTPGIITTNSFGPRVNFAVGSNPEGVAMQDLDGDGKPEIVTANTGGGTISVLRNIGTAGIIATGSFAPAVNFAGPTSIRDVAIADLDGDGRPDVVTVNYANGSNNVVSARREILHLPPELISRDLFTDTNWPLAMWTGTVNWTWFSFLLPTASRCRCIGTRAHPAASAPAHLHPGWISMWADGAMVWPSATWTGTGNRMWQCRPNCQVIFLFSETSARPAALPAVHLPAALISRRGRARMVSPSAIWMETAGRMSFMPTMATIPCRYVTTSLRLAERHPVILRHRVWWDGGRRKGMPTTALASTMAYYKEGLVLLRARLDRPSCSITPMRMSESQPVQISMSERAMASHWKRGLIRLTFLNFSRCLNGMLAMGPHTGVSTSIARHNWQASSMLIS